MASQTGRVPPGSSNSGAYLVNPKLPAPSPGAPPTCQSGFRPRALVKAQPVRSISSEIPSVCYSEARLGMDFMHLYRFQHMPAGTSA